MQHKVKQDAPSARGFYGISISRRGRLSLTTSFTRRHDTQPSTRAQLFWSARDRAIAVRFARGGLPGSYKVHCFPRQGNAFIDAADFFRWANIEIDGIAGRYAPIQLPASTVGIDNVEGDVFIIDLRKRIGTAHPQPTQR